MLKSKFHLGDAAEEEEEEEEPVPEPVKKKLIGVEQEGEDGPKAPEKKLDKYDVCVRLSMLGRTADGEGYTYLKVSITGLRLTKIDIIKWFHHLQFVDVSNNELDLESLQAVTKLPYLLVIQADKNVLQSAALKKCKYLQVIIFNENQLTTVHDVFQPQLSTLEVGKNRIHKIHFDNRMPFMRCLDFNNNLVEDIAGIDFPLLDSLYLAGNRIKSLAGLEKLVNLRILHVRNNPLRILDGFDEGMTKLHYINVRNCKISTMKQIKKLRVLPALDTLQMKGCPVMGGTGEEDAEVAQEEEDPELRVEVIALMPKLKRLNKQVITPEERGEAEELIKLWAEEGEKEDEEEIVEEDLEGEEVFHEEQQ